MHFLAIDIQVLPLDVFIQSEISIRVFKFLLNEFHIGLTALN